MNHTSGLNLMRLYAKDASRKVVLFSHLSSVVYSCPIDTTAQNSIRLFVKCATCVVLIHGVALDP